MPDQHVQKRRRAQEAIKLCALAEVLWKNGINRHNAVFLAQVLDDISEPGMSSDDIYAAISNAAAAAYDMGYRSGREGCCGCMFDPDKAQAPF
jgi:hypothetical protein